ncbi:MAG: hypothetical protein AB2L20_00915 [Mangrovibacterium sp.]
MIDASVVQSLMDRHKDLNSNPARYNETEHLNLAKVFPEGELAYWKNVKFSFVEQLRGSFVGLWYIQLGFPDLSKNSDFLNYAYSRIQDGIENRGSSENFWIEDLNTFFRWYYPYRRANAIIDGLTPKENRGQEIKITCNEERFLRLLTGALSKEKRQNMIEDIYLQLTGDPTKENIVAIASILYNGGTIHKNMKPRTFAKWLREFCECWNIKEVPTVKQSAGSVKRKIEERKSTFYYLSR